MKTGVIQERAGIFSLQYENNRGEKNVSRLDAATYELAVREARSFLGIKADNQDEDGNLWDVE
jgi:hypothetical protein